MTKLRRISELSLAALALSACGLLEGYGTGRPLTGAQLAQLHSIPTVTTGGSPDGSAWTIRRFPGGSQTIQWTRGRLSGSDQGRYEIRNDQLCSRWQNTANAAEQCDRYFSAGNKYQSFAADGRKLTAVFTVEPLKP